MVDLADQGQATHMLVVRHLDQVGALAGFLDLLRIEGIVAGSTSASNGGRVYRLVIMKSERLSESGNALVDRRRRAVQNSAC